MDPAKVLRKFGWKEGHGLGRNEQGIVKPLKASLKSGRGGVGLDLAAEISDHWWDTLYNNTASSISVESCEDGVIMKSTKKRKRNNGNAHCRLKTNSRKLCYGGFLQSNVVVCGTETVQLQEESKIKEDVKIMPMLTDDQLLAACGGRTAHKAARHGLTLNGKLHRIELQEQQLLGLQNEKKDLMSEDEAKKQRSHLDIEKDYSRKNKKRKLKCSEL